MASLDGHVANHVVKHCILGLLKNKTRIIVTEHRTLFYYANKILRVENGRVSPSEIVSGSFDSEYTEEELIDDSKMPSFELHDDGTKSVDSVMLDVCTSFLKKKIE